MEINVDGTVTINNIDFDVKTVEIDGEEVKLHKYPFYKIGRCNLKDIYEMHYGEIYIVKNGELLVECKNCENCPMCQEIELEVHLTPHKFKREIGYFCGYNNVYSENLKTLKHSKIKGKWQIELKKEYELIEEKFKYRRANYITNTSIEECIKDIQYCMTPSTEMEAINEYGHRRIELEGIRVYKNDYGYSVYHHGRMGDYGWSSTIKIHRRCNMNELVNELKQKFNTKFEIELK